MKKEGKKKRRFKQNTLLTYLTWFLISIILISIPFTKNFIEVIAFPLAIILILKDVIWDIILNKGPTKGFEHGPFSLIMVIAGLFGIMQLSIWSMGLFLADFIIDLLNDFGKM